MADEETPPTTDDEGESSPAIKIVDPEHPGALKALVQGRVWNAIILWFIIVHFGTQHSGASRRRLMIQTDWQPWVSVLSGCRPPPRKKTQTGRRPLLWASGLVS